VRKLVKNKYKTSVLDKDENNYPFLTKQAICSAKEGRGMSLYKVAQWKK